MVPFAVIGILAGGLLAVVRRWSAARAARREAARRERFAAIVLYEEMNAAIGGLDLALRADSPRWRASLSESRTLTEAWQEHGGALLGLGTERWSVLSDAVNAMAPNLELASARPHPEHARALLVERHRLLDDAAGVLRDVIATCA